jgi:hypothetical protein
MFKILKEILILNKKYLSQLVILLIVTLIISTHFSPVFLGSIFIFILILVFIITEFNYYNTFDIVKKYGVLEFNDFINSYKKCLKLRKENKPIYISEKFYNYMLEFHLFIINIHFIIDKDKSDFEVGLTHSNTYIESIDKFFDYE